MRKLVHHQSIIKNNEIKGKKIQFGDFLTESSTAKFLNSICISLARMQNDLFNCNRRKCDRRSTKKEGALAWWWTDFNSLFIVAFPMLARLICVWCGTLGLRQIAIDFMPFFTSFSFSSFLEQTQFKLFVRCYFFLFMPTIHDKMPWM